MTGALYGHNLVTDERFRERVDKHFKDHYWHRKMLFSFRIKSFITKLSKPQIKRSALAQRGSIFLNGASGDRVRNIIRAQFDNPIEASNYLFSLYEDRAQPSDFLPFEEDPLHVHVEAKNYFNHFHYMTESLQMFCTADTALVKNYHVIAKSDAVQPFIQAWTKESFGNSSNCISQAVSAVHF